VYASLTAVIARSPGSPAEQQQVDADVTDSIEVFDLLCSGFRVEPVSGV